MLIDISSVEEAVRFAQRIARKMSADPEVDSVAGEAAWRAMCSWDSARNVKMSWWIAQLTKQAVIHYWRRLARLRAKEKLRDEIWWQDQAMEGRIDAYQNRYDDDNLLHRIPKEGTYNDIPAEDFQLLIESYVLRWPLDVIARERGVSLHRARALRNAALSRLEAAQC